MRSLALDPEPGVALVVQNTRNIAGRCTPSQDTVQSNGTAIETNRDSYALPSLCLTLSNPQNSAPPRNSTTLKRSVVVEYSGHLAICWSIALPTQWWLCSTLPTVR